MGDLRPGNPTASEEDVAKTADSKPDVSQHYDIHLM